MENLGELVVKWVVLPLVVVLGIFVVGSFIEAAFHIPYAPIMLLAAAGGVAGVGAYFAKGLRG